MGEFNCPCGVAVGEDCSIYVVDNRNFRVQVFDEEGGFLRKFGSRGDGPGQFQEPDYIALGCNGEIFVSDSEQRGVLVFTRDGVYVQMIATGVGHELASGLAVDADGCLFVRCKGKLKMLV
jgi:sugar lactone lactonase YvrE